MSWHQSLRVLDANVFMASHNGPYAPNLCPGFWDCLSYCQFGVRYQDTYAMLSDLNVQFEWKRCPPTPPNAA